MIEVVVEDGLNRMGQEANHQSSNALGIISKDFTSSKSSHDLGTEP
jgi:hypothetical protein